MTSAPYLALREKGATVKISIGTALAVEGALGVYPDKPVTPAPIRLYQQVWFNMYTLLRNTLGSLTADQQRAVLPAELADALREDMLGADHAISVATKGTCKAVFYLNDYTSLPKRFPAADLKQPTTADQEARQALENATMALLSKSPPDVDVRSYGLSIVGHHPNALIVTHILVDLLSRYEFKRLDLLESHTGTIKPPAKWNTKLGLNPEAVDRIPFHPFTLAIFGDRSVQFRPQSLSLRRQLVQIATEDKWTSVSTMERIRVSIQNRHDPELTKACQPFYK